MINILEICKDASKIGITGHIRPDGDCIGATMALWQFLKKALPNALVEVVLQKPSPSFSCIKGVEELIEDTSLQEQVSRMQSKEYDVLFVCDSTTERSGIGAEYAEHAKTVVNIDHHISNNGCGDYNYIVQNASSTSELIYNLILEVDPQKQYMDVEIAKAIYMGIVHDTGIFQYSNTSPDTMRKAADLMEYGFDFSELIDETFNKKTYVQNQIMGRAMLESFRFMDGKCIVSMVDRKTMAFYSATSKDFEGVVNQLRIIKGVEVAIFMYETGTLQYKVSMRSNGDIDVAEVATYFGGGGHKRAAGCDMTGTFHDVVNNLSEQIEKQM
jgi:phosphoesterase RecJ-like protein